MTHLSDRRTIGLTEQGDLALNAHKRLKMVEGKQAVAQEMRITLNTIQGEDPFDAEHGLDVFDLTSADPSQVEPVFTRALEREHSDAIKNINEIVVETDAANRVSQVSIHITLIGGDDIEIEVSG